MNKSKVKTIKYPFYFYLTKKQLKDFKQLKKQTRAKYKKSLQKLIIEKMEKGEL